MDANRSPSLTAIFALFVLSGATSLVYEVLWLRQLILIFGSTQFATSTILSTFMGGLALGAFLVGRRLSGRGIRPLGIYGALEIGIGLYALLVPTLLGALSPIYRALWQAGASESFVVLSLGKFVGIAAILLPPTVLMGASLPVLARQVADDPDRIGGKVGLLYAVNTFGAVLGTFVAGFVAIPGIGMQRTLWVTAAVNVALGLAAIALVRRYPAVVVSRGRSPVAGRAAPSGGMRLVLLAFALSGFGALVLEVAWTRVLALVMGSSVYAFALMLLAFLIGLAAGGAVFSAVLRRLPALDPAVLLAALLGAAGVLAFATAFAFNALPRLFGEIYFAFHPGPTGWFAVQLVFGLMIMFPATFALGGIFPAVLQLHARSLDHVTSSVGTVYAANTAGTIVGAAAAGFLLLPTLGVLRTVVAVAILEIVLGMVVAIVMVRGSTRRRTVLAAPIGIALVLMVLFAPNWDVRMMNSGVYMNLFDVSDEQGWASFERMVYENNRVVYAAEGITATVFVADQPEFDNRYLSVNGKIEASTVADLETQLMCAHLPLLLHDEPRDVLIVGLASGITVGAAAAHPVDSIRVVEIEKAMIPAARLFAESNNRVLDDGRVSLSINDARNELEFSSTTYDVIISEPSNPWMTVAANLFTEEFFRMARTRVRPGGVFSQWIQTYYLPADDLRSIIAAFRAAFPNVMLFETIDGIDLLLLGSDDPLELDLDALAGRMTELDVKMDLARVGMRHPIDVVSMFRLGTGEIDALTAGAPRNTDDNARVEFSAPKTLGVSTVVENLEMIRAHRADPLDYLVPPPTDPIDRDRLRMGLAEASIRRGDLELAEEHARQVTDPPLKARAERLLEQARGGESNL
ncbi:MAG TPA: fused MFS/spermidine synthase [Candidatus Polarisedimenticolaceae bacterium]|nr:fused MFS/spermidine synthase [Candidatus Polarisedimenticolaceae bacterium]